MMSEKANTEQQEDLNSRMTFDTRPMIEYSEERVRFDEMM
jgi:hypothetical protein